MINCPGIRYLILFLLLSSYSIHGLAQPTLDPDMPKPKKYENRVLRAEKTGQKKLTIPRRFAQNTYTHYNFTFNAREKLRQVLENAKSQHVDRYGELLSFYNYTLELTSNQRTELDSIIYKANAGILLHDLRNNWIDNLYLLMGQAYYYRGQLDTAFMTFQYMNYAFSPKEEDGYDKVIASNSNEGGNNLKVATEEKRNFAEKFFSEAPNRNDALVWLVRTHIAAGEMDKASALIQTLRNDPLFPERLDPQLAEVTAWWNYQNNQYDSAAFYLEKALPVAANKQEQARWEYLLGQLYYLSGNKAAARDAFQRCIKHTLNPIMEVAAQLQYIQQTDSLDEKQKQQVIETLITMAKRERYTNYRDLIYFTIAEIQVNQSQIQDAIGSLHKSIKYSTVNPEQRARSWFMLGSLHFDQREYVGAKTAYDSTDLTILPEKDALVINQRKDVLATLSTQYGIISRQDSLQYLASLPEAERNEILKKHLKQLQKKLGIKDETSSSSSGWPVFTPSSRDKAPSDLFASSNSGDFYFYNNNLKSRGFTEFRARWGDRKNVDNWRRSSTNPNETYQKEENLTGNNKPTEQQDAISIEGLTSALPLTPEKLKASNDSILEAGYLLAYAAQNRLEDYITATSQYEDLLKRFPENSKQPDILYNLAICYRKLGKNDLAARTVHDLATQYPQSRQAKLSTNPREVQAADNAVAKKATETYNQIYDQFISGNFEAALKTKLQADSSFGKNYWTPQLLYIEAVYHIKQKNDSAAIAQLKQISSQFPGHPLAAKASNMISVLERRKEIEKYLTDLQVEAPKEDSIRLPEEKVIIAAEEPTIKPGIIKTPIKLVPTKTADSLKIEKKLDLKVGSIFARHSEQPHFVAVVVHNVDPVFVNETRNAFIRYNKERYPAQTMNVVIISITEEFKMVTINGMANEQAAVDYIKQARGLAEKDIIPWLKPDKYYFMPVAEDNMNLLINNKNLPEYRSFLKLFFGDQF